MVSKPARAVDPEISALTAQVRGLVGEAYRLTRDIDATMESLDQYVDQYMDRPKGKDSGNG